VHLELATPYMLARIEDGVGWITMNNPERHNALKVEMNEAMLDIIAAFQANDEVRVVVLHGAGDRAFAAGADISEFESNKADAEQSRFDSLFDQTGRAFAALTKPVVAMIQGYCIGGGLATALHADLRISADDGQFAIPAARLGIGYGFEALTKLVHVVGPAAASEILLTARKFTASEAYDMGLVNRVVPSGDLLATVTELASTIAANAPLSMAAAKSGIQETFKDPNARDKAAMNALAEACFASQDYVEGQQAFLEKRRPNFRGA